jgi:hypothetical protein
MPIWQQPRIWMSPFSCVKMILLRNSVPPEHAYHRLSQKICLCSTEPASEAPPPPGITGRLQAATLEAAPTPSTAHESQRAAPTAGLDELVQQLKVQNESSLLRVARLGSVLDCDTTRELLSQY